MSKSVKRARFSLWTLGRKKVHKTPQRRPAAQPNAATTHVGGGNVGDSCISVSRSILHFGLSQKVPESTVLVARIASMLLDKQVPPSTVMLQVRWEWSRSSVLSLPSDLGAAELCVVRLACRVFSSCNGEQAWTLLDK